MFGTRFAHEQRLERAYTMLSRRDSPNWRRTGQTARALSGVLPPWATRVIVPLKVGSGRYQNPCNVLGCPVNAVWSRTQQQCYAAQVQKNERPRVSIKMDLCTRLFTFFPLSLHSQTKRRSGLRGTSYRVRTNTRERFHLHLYALQQTGATERYTPLRTRHPSYPGVLIVCCPNELRQLRFSILRRFP